MDVTTYCTWLVIAAADADAMALVQRLAHLGCRRDTALTPVVLGEREQVLEIEGPADLQQRVVGVPGIIRACHGVQLEPVDDDEAHRWS